MYLFLSQKEWQLSIFWSVLCRFHFFYHFLSLAVTHCHLLPLAVIRCYSLSLVATSSTTRCHSLSFLVPLVDIRFHSLSLVVTSCTTRCHSLLFLVPLVDICFHSLSFVVTRCTTRCYSLSLNVPIVARSGGRSSRGGRQLPPHPSPKKTPKKMNVFGQKMTQLEQK